MTSENQPTRPPRAEAVSVDTTQFPPAVIKANAVAELFKRPDLLTVAEALNASSVPRFDRALYIRKKACKIVDRLELPDGSIACRTDKNCKSAVGAIEVVGSEALSGIHDAHDALEAIIAKTSVREVAEDPDCRHYGATEQQSQTLLYGSPTPNTVYEACLGSGTIACNRANFTNAPQHLHGLDLDDLHAPSSLCGQQLEAHEPWLRGILPDWLAKATLIVMATGSHGTMHSSGAHNYVPKLRIAFWLSDPVSPTGFKRYAAEISKHIEATGVTFSGKSPLDLSIYSPERMLFFNAPEVHGGGSPFNGSRIAMLDDDGDAADEAVAPEPKAYKAATTAASNVTELAPVAVRRRYRRNQRHQRRRRK